MVLLVFFCVYYNSYTASPEESHVNHVTRGPAPVALDIRVGFYEAPGIRNYG